MISSRFRKLKFDETSRGNGAGLATEPVSCAVPKTV